MVPHVGVVNLLHSAHNRYPLDHEWAFGVSQNYVFDMSVFVLFACLALVGGHCVLLEGPLSLLDLEDARITHLKDVPSIVGSARIPDTIKHVHERLVREVESSETVAPGYCQSPKVAPRFVHHSPMTEQFPSIADTQFHQNADQSLLR